MRRFCQHRRRPEVNQAVVDGVSRSCLKLQSAVEKGSLLFGAVEKGSPDLNQERLSSSTTA